MKEEPSGSSPSTAPPFQGFPLCSSSQTSVVKEEESMVHHHAQSSTTTTPTATTSMLQHMNSGVASTNNNNNNSSNSYSSQPPTLQTLSQQQHKQQPLSVHVPTSSSATMNSSPSYSSPSPASSPQQHPSHHSPYYQNTSAYVSSPHHNQHALQQLPQPQSQHAPLPSMALQLQQPSLPGPTQIMTHQGSNSTDNSPHMFQHQTTKHVLAESSPSAASTTASSHTPNFMNQQQEQFHQPPLRSNSPYPKHHHTSVVPPTFPSIMNAMAGSKLTSHHPHHQHGASISSNTSTPSSPSQHSQHVVVNTRQSTSPPPQQQPASHHAQNQSAMTSSFQTAPQQAVFHDYTVNGQRKNQVTMSPQQQQDINMTGGDFHPIACIPCRKRHKKCDRRLPQCSECIRRSMECQFYEPKQKGRKKKDGEIGTEQNFSSSQPTSPPQQPQNSQSQYQPTQNLSQPAGNNNMMDLSPYPTASNSSYCNSPMANSSQPYINNPAGVVNNNIQYPTNTNKQQQIPTQQNVPSSSFNNTVASTQRNASSDPDMLPLPYSSQSSVTRSPSYFQKYRSEPYPSVQPPQNHQQTNNMYSNPQVYPSTYSRERAASSASSLSNSGMYSGSYSSNPSMMNYSEINSINTNSNNSNGIPSFAQMNTSNYNRTISGMSPEQLQSNNENFNTTSLSRFVPIEKESLREQLSNLSRAQVESWPSHAVSQWIESIDTAFFSNKIGDLFAEHDVDGVALLGLHNQALLDMGIHKVGIRVKLCRIIEHLRMQN
nr:unnamed protein product [Naegleria fowleri]